ncbi:MAG: pseudouridine synthase [Firmicutes bacterium]|nr:pseudouridine synthase [Bacillota bacterium]
MRIQKYLSTAGFCSRRKAEELILENRIKINNKSASIGDIIDISKDKVFVDGKLINNNTKQIYILLYKPKGYVSTTSDPEGRKTVLDLVTDIKERIYPVGRLDYDTEGLLIMTNDGEFTNILTHPSHLVEKVYKAKCSGNITKEKLNQLEDGILIENEYMTNKANIYYAQNFKDYFEIEIGIKEGRNRQVRKMFAELKNPVLSLKRIKIGFLTIDKLKRGKYRELTKKEIEKLKKLEVNKENN